MAKACGSCGYYATNGDETSCPMCKRALQFTLLPARGTVDEPAIKLPPPLTRGPAAASYYRTPGSDPIDWFLRNRKLVGICVFPILLLIGMAFSPGGAGAVQKAKEKYDHIRNGMSPVQVEALLTQGSSRYSRDSLFDDLDDNGNGDMVWSSRGVMITVHFWNGRVTRKEQVGLNQTP